MNTTFRTLPPSREQMFHGARADRLAAILSVMLRVTLAALHLIALGIGLGAVWMRATALRAVDRDRSALRRAFGADAVWGIAALLWISTGLWRLFAALEKAPDYYWRNVLFHTKMGLLVVVLLLEVWPMITLIRWRMASGGRGSMPSGGRLAVTARRIASISNVQAVLIVLMVLTAVGMARGYGLR